MPTFTKPRWVLSEREATPESIFYARRTLIKSAGLGMIGAAVAAPAHAGLLDNIFGADTPTADSEVDPTADLYPVPRNEAYTHTRPITDEGLATTYNNFYEFGSHKRIYNAAQKLAIRPWSVILDGMVEQEQTIDIDTLIRQMPLEERVYRHRCVEAWSMVVPWTGFAMADFVKLARPTAGAKYVRMETFENPEVASGQRQSWYPWPYVEGVTLEEATNPLAFLVTGVYGKPVPEQNGAPLRLALPWKYGFKSIKSLVRFTFTDQKPVSFWEELAPTEYGFWANVNPEVAHPRWSQAEEKPLGADEEIPTQLYNGYAEEVAGLYKGMEGERIYF
ncbi:protein-methionine-sulfoxide reductase catalytic subunit MsrP [Acuticoccus sp. I52.16.1]|uniref:protein-methionine-sulfoxide reductase catalytic subunit MsrP n=1 Tax=Acuticoccus sp. I52.16.1 TaxID=2928472 RepID=UPI001FD1CDCA|nr:protein-methionine-sulfoxide reductase catalytic subunit MsrP [Acuticoccus sp. I52.16.1]UOM32755.1 protein-methionine-sulfoxide reductase catalytic subunit MsrP [Acuticoccus sp. I52.16.1]